MLDRKLSNRMNKLGLVSGLALGSWAAFGGGQGGYAPPPHFWQWWYRKFDGRKEGNALINDTLNTFYLRLYDLRHMVKDHPDSERGNLLPPHGLLFLISSKGSFIYMIPQTG